MDSTFLHPEVSTDDFILDGFNLWLSLKFHAVNIEMYLSINLRRELHILAKIFVIWLSLIFKTLKYVYTFYICGFKAQLIDTSILTVCHMFMATFKGVTHNKKKTHRELPSHSHSAPRSVLTSFSSLFLPSAPDCFCSVSQLLLFISSLNMQVYFPWGSSNESNKSEVCS